MIETGLIRAVRQRQTEEDTLAAFVELLLAALEVPEVADAVAAALPSASPSPRPTAPARGQPTGRGRGRR